MKEPQSKGKTLISLLVIGIILMLFVAFWPEVTFSSQNFLAGVLYPTRDQVTEIRLEAEPFTGKTITFGAGLHYQITTEFSTYRKFVALDAARLNAEDAKAFTVKYLRCLDENIVLKENLNLMSTPCPAYNGNNFVMAVLEHARGEYKLFNRKTGEELTDIDRIERTETNISGVKTDFLIFVDDYSSQSEENIILGQNLAIVNSYKL